MFENCYLHIGADKTGSSSLQVNLYRSRGELHENGFLYPKNLENHIFLATAFLSDAHKLHHHISGGRTDPAAIANYLTNELTRFENEVSESSAHTLLISSEQLSFVENLDIQGLRDYLSRFARNIHIILYIREPVSHATSSLQQAIKSGLSTFQNYDYTFLGAQTARAYTQVFGKENMIVRPFERQQLSNGDIWDDYCSLVGLDSNITPPSKRIETNEAVSFEGLAIAEALYRQLPLTTSDGGWNREVAKRNEFHNIAGRKFELPLAVREEIFEASRADLGYLEREFSLSLPQPDFTSDASSPWAQPTINSIALRLNELQITVEKLSVALLVKHGDIAAMQGENLEAVKFYVNALERSPTEASVLAKIYNLILKHPEVNFNLTALCEKFVHQNPGDIRFIEIACASYFRIGNTEQAKALASQLLSQDAHNKTAKTIESAIEKRERINSTQSDNT
ncbi:hypothetical protein [Kordiimonas sp.]|uniref:hypothetical protein n=1 Tax=Kordiimonas sp. TaxID=1970157 RepID=UPI003A90A20A